jgi:hypothetical protein
VSLPFAKVQDANAEACVDVLGGGSRLRKSSACRFRAGRRPRADHPPPGARKKHDRGSGVHEPEGSKVSPDMCKSSAEYVTACSTSGRDEMRTGKKWASRIYSRRYII